MKRKVSDVVDGVVAEAYRRMRDAGLSHLEAAEFLQRWEDVATEADLEKAVEDLGREVDTLCKGRK
jgi:hypothetical protein